jgi:hypothetical protein
VTSAVAVMEFHPHTEGKEADGRSEVKANGTTR